MAEYDSVVPPGGKGQVVVKVKTRGIQGRRAKSVRIDTNDPRQRQLRLTVSFESIMPIEVYPHPRATLYGYVGQGLDSILVVRRRDGQPLELGEPKVIGQVGVEVKVEPVDAAHEDPPRKQNGARAGDWRLHVAASGVDRPQAAAGQIVIPTNHPEKPELRLPLTLRVQPVLVVQPQRILLSGRAGHEAAVRSVVTIRNGARQPFRVKGVSLSGELDGVTASLRYDRHAAVQQIDVVLDASGLAAGIRRGTLVIDTDLKARPREEIPVRVTIGPPLRAPATTDAGAPAADPRGS